jgi:pimeloyl-ACP methyl ester carboxylesterase/DNA-binding winged helix-turn-helix (wHTH) protein
MIFGPFTLDPVSGHLYKDGATVPLAPKAFAVLQFLLENAGRLVSKRELFDHVWSGVFVSDAVLKVTIRDIRKALGDDPRSPTYIETAHRRGYRFVHPVHDRGSDPLRGLTPFASTSEGTGSGDSRISSALESRVGISPTPEVHYARSGEVNVAYQVVGSGPIDLVFVMGWVSHLEYFWNEPSFARFLTRLASIGRLILFDKRGTGLSDPVPTSELPTLEQRMDDVRAVMEAAGSTRAVLLGVSEGGPLCTLFAATYPEKTEALIMVGSYARRLRDTDYAWGPTGDERDAFCQTLLDEWGGPVGIDERAPSVAKDPAFRAWWASYLRMGASPGAAVALTRMNSNTDVRGVLSSIRVPTLVLHRTGDRCLRIEEGRYLASRISGARFVELAGDDHLPFVGDQDALLGEIERFLATRRAPPFRTAVLASVLSVRCPVAGDRPSVRSLFDRELTQFRGRPLTEREDVMLAIFDGPARAVRCGAAVVRGATALGTACGAGVHIGEFDATAPEGPVTDLSARLAAAAHTGEVLVSRTIVDLVPGSGLEFHVSERPLVFGSVGSELESCAFVLAGTTLSEVRG